MGKRFALIAGLAGVLLGLSACNSSSFVAVVMATVTDDTPYLTGLTIGPGTTMVVDESATTGTITITVTGTFVCAGVINILDTTMTLIVNVYGDVILSCTVMFPPDGTPPTLFQVVSAGSYSLLPGFKVVNGDFTPPDGTPPT